MPPAVPHISRRRLLAAGLLPAAGPLLPALARAAGASAAEGWPGRPIRVVLGFPPGGSDDFLIRVLAPPLSEVLGQPLVIENRAGATANIAAAYVAHAQADGYTVFFGPTSLLAASRSLYAKLNYDLLSDFAFVTLVGVGPTVLLANPSLPARSLAEFVALAKARPDQIRYGSGGVGSLAHLSMELLESRAGIRLIHVPYKGAAPNAIALTGGEVEVSFAGVSSSYALIRSGQLNALAVSGTRRLPSLPQVPTIAESGYPGYNVNNTYGLLAPAGTPARVVQLLGDAVRQVLKSPDVQAKFDSQGVEPGGGSAAAYRQTTEQEAATWAQVVKQAGIRAE
jgi:tripartite-type tricarboxylate transporter receptor subunit TctC